MTDPNPPIGKPPRDPSADLAVALGHTIRVIRTDQALSRSDLAKRAGISYSYLSAIENGTKPPSTKIQMVLAAALGVKLHELLAAAEARSETGAVRHSELGRAGLEDAMEFSAGAGYEASPAEAPQAPSRRSRSWGRGREPIDELDEILDHQAQRKAARDQARLGLQPRLAAPQHSSPQRTELGALTELRQLLPRMTDDDIEFLLEMARRLAGD